MRDESISQAEIDALVRGILGQETSSGTPAAAPAQDDMIQLQKPLDEIVAAASRTLGDLLGAPCQAVLVQISTMSMATVVSLFTGKIVVGKTDLISGLSGSIFYVMTSDLGMAIVTQLYGGVTPSAMDESARGALAEGVSQMNQTGLARLAEIVGRPVFSGQVDISDAGSIVEVKGVPIDQTMLLLQLDMIVGDTVGRVVMGLPQEVKTELLAAIKPKSVSPPSTPASMSAAATQAPSFSPVPAGQMPGLSVAMPPASPAYPAAQFPDLGGPPRLSQEAVRNIDLLMDVTLQVTVELGRTRKQIRDVLALGPGSVVELDKLAGEQVDVLVNGKLIAKAEVVVIDENYGVRIMDIIDQAERVKSLK